MTMDPYGTRLEQYLHSFEPSLLEAVRRDSQYHLTSVYDITTLLE
jgi:hypothetical protein